jgi:hypothetical protein
MKTKDCETCGNPIPVTSADCRFCGSRQNGGNQVKPREKVRTVNIEAGMPTVEEALATLDARISRAMSDGVRLLRVIHGYGSTGRGGKIRDACRAALQRKIASRQVRVVIRGEDYLPASLAVRDLVRRFPELKTSERTDAGNPGITFVEL